MKDPVRTEEADTVGALLEFIRERFCVEEGRQVAPSTPLFAEGIVDSIGLLELISFVETRFGISIEPQDLVLENFESADSIRRFIERRS